MTWQLFFNKDPAIGKIIEVFDNKTKSHMFARRIGSKGHLIQLSTAYTNGGIGIHPQEMFYESFLRDYGQTSYWRVFVKP